MRAVLLLVGLAACAPGNDSGGGVVVDPPDAVELNDLNGALEVDISGGSAPGWSFGGVWLDVDLTDEGCLGADDVCHTLGASGGSFAIDDCDTPSDATSCIPVDGYRLGHMTFVLKPSVGSGCWVWGQDVDYYASLGCTVTDWPNDSY